MAEYIERETAIKALMNDAPEQVGYSREDAADCIRYMDAADVVKVRKGRWESVGMSSLKCSDCGYLDDMKMYHRYCPDCGCFMR